MIMNYQVSVLKEYVIFLEIELHSSQIIYQGKELFYADPS